MDAVTRTLQGRLTLSLGKYKKNGDFRLANMNNLFSKALEESNARQLKESADGMFQLYRLLQEAGFDKQEAMTILLGMMPKKKVDDEDA